MKLTLKIIIELFYTFARFASNSYASLARVYHMKPTGFEVISEQDCKELHYMYADEKK